MNHFLLFNKDWEWLNAVVLSDLFDASHLSLPEIYTIQLAFAVRRPDLAHGGLRRGRFRFRRFSERRCPLSSLRAHFQLCYQLVKILAPSNNLPSLVNGVNLAQKQIK